MAKYNLRPHQITDLAFYLQNDKCGNLSDPGCDKTGSVCVYIQYLYEHKNKISLWAMPKSLIGKNREELLNFTDLRPDQIMVLDGTPSQRTKLLESGEPAVILMSFQRWATDWEMLKAKFPKIDAMMFDEFHMGGFKKPTSKRSQALFKSARTLSIFLPMSGSLVAGRLDSCYSAIHVIEPRYYFDHYSFLQEHGIFDDYNNVVAWKNHDKIGRIFIRHCIRRSFKETHGEKARVIIKEKVKMNEELREIYEEFENNALLELEDSFLEGGNPAVATMRCRQIMAHPHTLGTITIGGREIGIKNWSEDNLTSKEEALQVHVEDHINTGKPLLIFASLQPEQERIVALCKKWGLSGVELINASVSGQKRIQIDTAFRAGTLQCVVASPATASVGFNWGHVDHIVFMSLDYENVNFIQAYGRAIRGKRDTPVLIHIMEYEKSIDQRIMQIIDQKSADLHKIDPTYEKLELSKGG